MSLKQELGKFRSKSTYDFAKQAIASLTASGSFSGRWGAFNSPIGLPFMIDLSLTEAFGL